MLDGAGRQIATAEAIAAHAHKHAVEEALIRTDAGWMNFLTALGTDQDKRTHSHFRADVVAWQEAIELWRGNPLAARAVEMRPFEYLRKNFELRIASTVMTGARDLMEWCSDHWRDISLKQNLRETLNYENAYGGGATLLGANDGQSDLSKPLDEERITAFDWVNALEARELIPVYYYSDARDPKYGQPAVYQITPLIPGTPVETYDKMLLSTMIHETRLLAFRGIRVSRANVQLGALVFAGWGDSRLTRIHEALKDYGIAWGHAATLVTDFAQPVYQFENLAALMATEEGRALITARLVTMDKARSILRAMLLDTKDSYHRETTPMGGLSDILTGFERQICMALDAPQILVFGNKAGGLDASGAADVQLWYDRLMAECDDKLAPPLRRVARLSMRLKNATPSRFSIFFPPLYQMSEPELATYRKTIAETDEINIDNGVYTSSEARKSHYCGDEFNAEVVIDEDADDEVDPDDADAYAKEQEGGDVDEDGNPRDGDKPVSTTALMGPQALAMLQIVTSATNGTISRESATAMLQTIFSLTPEQAEAVLGPEDFEPTKPPAPPAPFGAGPPKPFEPKQPGATVPVAPLVTPKPAASPAKADTQRSDRVVEREGKWYVLAESGDKELGGPYDTKGEADKRLGQIEYFKHEGA